MSLEGGKTRSFNYCFAGVDKDAVDAAHTTCSFPPSPSMALFKNGRISTHERHHIEGRPAELIAENLKDAFNEYC
jgi:putative YphP/YqiW family bacilliredoxin